MLVEGYDKRFGKKRVRHPRRELGEQVPDGDGVCWALFCFWVSEGREREREIAVALWKDGTNCLEQRSARKAHREAIV
jgi:hypothetical protein